MLARKRWIRATEKERKLRYWPASPQPELPSPAYNLPVRGLKSRKKEAEIQLLF
ncbi:hypothetical protein [Bacillus sp. P14.5]|uniref:hypothetical protein n=1 Tax=Bacillus sp. P14.5 TaxID=1983400 RepID=UPI0013B05AA1|nr:hypothetical protein [Bacillus sp. P14.5]